MRWGIRAGREAGDRREYGRRPVRLPVTLASPSGVREGRAVDLSMNGGFACHRRIPGIGEKLSVKVHTLDDRPPIEVDKAVVRTVSPGRLGVEFLALRPPEAARLRALMQSLWMEGAEGIRKRASNGGRGCSMRHAAVALCKVCTKSAARMSGPEAWVLADRRHVLNLEGLSSPRRENLMARELLYPSVHGINGPIAMKPILCASCGKTLTLAIWDKRTEQVYCRYCIPPMPVHSIREWPGPRKQTTRKDPADMNFTTRHE